MTETAAELKIEKAHCPTCDGVRKCFLHGKVYKPWDWEDRQGNGVSGGNSYSLFECCGCEAVFHEKSSWNTEDTDWYYDREGNSTGEAVHTKITYPKPEAKNKPNWFDALVIIDEPLFIIMSQAYIAYDNEAYILAAVGLRTALDRSTEVLKIDPAISFEEKLDALKSAGSIGEAEHKVLTVVTNAGNAAAHRGWSPTLQELNQLMAAMEVFLHRSFIVGSNALSLTPRIPEKPKRQRKSRKPEDATKPA